MNMPAARNDALEAEVQGRIGVLPNFFRLGPEAPEVDPNLLGIAKAGYLDNPLPPLFKRRLFVVLSRFCEVRYGIARHVGFLVGLGQLAGDRNAEPLAIEQVIRLIRRAVPRSADELAPHLALLHAGAAPLPALPGPDTAAEQAIFACATQVFLQTAQARHCLEALRHCFTAATQQHLLLFLAFVRTAHFWTQVHPELNLEADVTELLQVHQALAECALNDPEAHSAGTTQVLQTELALLRREPHRAAPQPGAQPALRQGDDLDPAPRGEGRRAEDALRISDELHRIAFDQAPTGMAYVGTQQRYTKVNERLCEITGYSATELLHMPIAQLTHPDDRARDAPLLNAFLSGAAPTYEAEKRYVRKDGGVRWVAVTARAVADAQGHVVHRVSVIRDITEHKRNVLELQRAHQKLHSVAALFTTVIEQAPMGVYVVDADFRLLQVNSQAMPVFANVRPLLGRDFSDVLAVLWGPQLGPQLVAIFRHTLDTGERYESPPFVEQRHDLGREQAYEWETQRVTLPDGRHGVVCYFHEVTERAHAQAKLLASEERIRLATETTGVGIWEWSVLTGHVRWNAQMFRIYGIAPTPDGQVNYNVWRDAVWPDDLAQQEATLQATVAQGGRSRRAFRIRRADDGALRHIQSVEAARVNEQGHTEWVVGTNLDVTASVQADEGLRRLASELADADRRKDAFLATLAHELRNPLAPLRNALELIKRSDDPARTEQARAVMERQVRHMVRLIDDLLDVGRIAHDKLELRRQRIELGSVLRQAVEAAAPDIERCGHELTLTLPREPVWLDADPVRLVQVVGNLLSNACKFTAPGGRIVLRAECESRSVALTVKDSGDGIAADMLGKVFELFTQVSGAQQRSAGGLGIGLALVKRLVEMHGGSVAAHSAGVGHGSEFVFRLPLGADSGTQPPHPLAAVAEPAPSAGWRILVVDDNRDAADSLAAILSLSGHQTHIAHDGAQALEMATALRPEVMLLDIGLPKLNGYQVCRALREQPWGKGVVVVALTGWGQDEQRARTSEAGFDAHIIKPVDPDGLASLLVSLRAAATLTSPRH